MFYADLHIHSKYSRATSRNLDLENLCLYGAKKGLSVISTGDFTHPKWFSEINEKLDYTSNGLFELKKDIQKEVFKNYPNLTPPKFLLSVEISTIYKDLDKTRKVHHVVFCPDIISAQKFRNKLSSIGNINSDGRPILGLKSRDLLEIVLETSSDSYIIPAHIWTPWFSVLGSKSGYNSIEECYKDLSDYIFALETGLSSDPMMNWKVSRLDRFRLVSNSDAHSAGKLAREATIFKDFPDYFYIKNALKNGNGYIGTVEFYPEEGKYHLDGHRKCSISLSPDETKKLNGICPVCNKPLTIGVLNRVYELSDRFDNSKPKTAGEVFSLIPLNEIISEIFNLGVSSKKVECEYERLIHKFGSELSILSNVDLNIIEKDSPILSEALMRLRKSKVIKNSGFDGEYGKIKLFKEGEVESFYNLKLGLDIVPTAKKEEVIDCIKPEKNIKKEEIKKEKTFDTSQIEAIYDKNPRLVVKAGPGSGKTSVLVKRISDLIINKKKNSFNFLAITFTKKASNEMFERLKKDNCKSISIHTFHSFCFQVLKENYSKINLNEDFKIITNEEKELNKDIENSLSFDDLIKLTLKLFQLHPDVLKKYQDRFKYIFIDEYQDIDINQYNLIKLLVTVDTFLFVIGDSNQAIYGFRGGSKEFFDNFTKDYKEAKIINLKNNYRSSFNIVQFSNDIINSNNISQAKTNNEKIIIHNSPTPKSEAEFVVSTIERLLGGQSFFSMDSKRAFGYENEENYSISDFAVLYRSKTQLEPIYNAFNNLGIPYANYSDDLLCNRKEIREFLINLKDNDILTQVKTLGNKVENSVLEYFIKLAQKNTSKEEFIHEVSFLTLADTFDKRADRVSLMTLHASKGLEFRCVFIIGASENYIPHFKAKNNEEIEEEKRLFYVGVSRAKERLFISNSKVIKPQGKFIETKPTRFLDKINKNLVSYYEFKPKQNAKQLKLF